MTASAGSTASGDGAADALGAAEAPADAGGVEAGAVEGAVLADGDGDADPLHATNNTLVAMARVRVRLSFTGVLLLEWRSARRGWPQRGLGPSTDGFACDHPLHVGAEQGDRPAG